MKVCSTLACGGSAEHRDGGRAGLCSRHYKRVQTGMTVVRGYRSRGGKRTQADILARDAQGNKQCTGCAQWLPESSFRNAARTADGLASQCGGCHVSRSHGMVSELEYQSLLALQDGCCGACGRHPKNGERLVIDHDHSCCPGVKSCGECIRGLLCAGCNAGIGLLGDSPEGLERALIYLVAARLDNERLVV